MIEMWDIFFFDLRWVVEYLIFNMGMFVKTTNLKKYCVRPNIGPVLPRSTCDLTGLQAWSCGNFEEFGTLISASGLSSIQNYECGCEPLIQLYEILLRAPGVYGAWFNGAGFRGCYVAFLNSDYADKADSFVKNEYFKVQPELAEVSMRLVCVEHVGRSGPPGFSKCDPSEKDACDKGCSGGLMTNAYGYLMKAGGIQLEESYPYTGKSNKCRFDSQKIAVKVANFTNIPADEEQMAVYLVNHGPLAGKNALT
ncbi:putative galacturonokinase [Helianthus anomalus]